MWCREKQMYCVACSQWVLTEEQLAAKLHEQRDHNSQLLSETSGPSASPVETPSPASGAASQGMPSQIARGRASHLRVASLRDEDQDGDERSPKRLASTELLFSKNLSLLSMIKTRSSFWYLLDTGFLHFSFRYSHQIPTALSSILHNNEFWAYSGLPLYLFLGTVSRDSVATWSSHEVGRMHIHYFTAFHSWNWNCLHCCGSFLCSLLFSGVMNHFAESWRAGPGVSVGNELMKRNEDDATLARTPAGSSKQIGISLPKVLFPSHITFWLLYNMLLFVGGRSPKGVCEWMKNKSRECFEAWLIH